jgi:hypothetical protein
VTVRNWKNVLAGAVGCFVGGLLVSHAYGVQGGTPTHLLPYGCLLGASMGVAVAAHWIRARVAAAATGSIAALTSFTCLPCDGSNFIMPAFGAVTGWGVAVIWNIVTRTPRPPAA